ncbi:MAG: arginyltransferase [gamma proteobacterium endosymbiont of Lamellibrachia anaximandri]|nr:arginyltransferase [gamma proteobacterium endosymbiont of Lamellibrachia anaximandri]MBL3618578.1 arginyltransferase [gamma proteobacterium endosymbiont of Lamellibrachia anaximandri]
MNNDQVFTNNPTLALYLSQEHDCSYLPGQQARTLFLDPSTSVDALLYQFLIDQGFRRSGAHLYRPACNSCNACTSLRLPVAEFRPNRSQRRCWKRNIGHFSITPCPAEFDEEHYALYVEYLQQRHPDGSMSNTDPQQYLNFLTTPWAETVFYEFRCKGRLAAVAATDLLPEGISSVYTFFDPGMQTEGIGVFSLLWQIQHAAKLGRHWLYPGYWIRNCSKMNYKSRYRPLEAWNGLEWLRFGSGETLLLP